jgi:membrane-bound lytic murein transglycosylase MltF
VETERQREFMLASYNAGRATLLRAQRMAEAMKLNHRQ